MAVCQAGASGRCDRSSGWRQRSGWTGVEGADQAGRPARSGPGPHGRVAAVEHDADVSAVQTLAGAEAGQTRRRWECVASLGSAAGLGVGGGGGAVVCRSVLVEFAQHAAGNGSEACRCKGGGEGAHGAPEATVPLGFQLSRGRPGRRRCQSGRRLGSPVPRWKGGRSPDSAETWAARGGNHSARL